ncbi:MULTISPECIES: patatin-like phospholipase family protein [unclassified Bradyrhizobium]|uniref:patatin-like phospholipase family protein n=1 Tax=unclassified Bradyrhizobium TaxID=2631580 RepID=UPI0028ECACEC|nr:MULTISPECIES: patatin-like phospholipase family protein [unclassified Bradyrhizobium]
MSDSLDARAKSRGRSRKGTPEERHEQAVLRWEKRKLAKTHARRIGQGESDDWKGIGLSGGGIRSATFSLGALQALVAHGLLAKFDYISTVSGGGYIGSSLQWWWSEARAKEAAALAQASVAAQAAGRASHPGTTVAAGPRIYGVDRDNFPYGCDHLSNPNLSDSPDQKCNLAFLRNHGNYLVSGQGITALSGIYVVLRTLLISLIVWLPLIFFLFLIVQLINLGLTFVIEHVFPALDRPLPGFPESWFTWTCMATKPQCPFALPPLYTLALVAYAVGVLFFVFMSLLFALLTRVPSEVGQGPRVSMAAVLSAAAGAAMIIVPILLYWRLISFTTLAVIVASSLFGIVLIARFVFEYFFRGSSVTASYWWRRTLEEWFGVIFAIGLVVLVVGSLPVLPFFLAQKITASSGPSIVFTAFFTVLSGAASALYGYYSFVKKIDETIAARVFVPLGAAIFLYGTLTFGYIGSVFVFDVFSQKNSPLLPGGLASYKSLIAYASTVFVIVGVVLSIRANVNQIGLHRFYRDRLMEAFLPSTLAVKIGRATYSPVADSLNLVDLRSSYSPSARQGSPVPYPLINTFGRIVRDVDPRIVNRGGVNFILSPFYIGSRSTGWEDTKSYTDEDRYGPLTLATAMAASGAAVNSNAGYIGTGFTRNRLVSAVMTILNMRLGIWVGNPWLKGERRSQPAYWSPTLTAGLLGYGRARTGAFIEISDGGNFENLGLYELVRRKLGIIVLIDGEADATIALPALVSAAVRIKEDFKATLTFEPAAGVDRLLPVDKEVGYPAGAHFAKSPYVVGRVRYEDGSPDSIVIYLKATLIRDLDFTTAGYRAGSPDFPHETTLDQFFDPSQFEAYRDLGFRSASIMIRELGLAGSGSHRFPSRDELWSSYSNPGAAKPGAAKPGATEPSAKTAAGSPSPSSG